eukprot:TRINITY_DN19919_c0_g1_i2.p1 TRINITY_DN19919_c0_g1~~TRINITY_DN19919_c0_g1_i2.p1  ORF type:complete len:577 (+),score=97.25 TRINITY_DN19919_c0_g1_i2:336-2066(+)
MDPSLQTLHAFGGETLGKHRNGIRLKGWRIETRKCPILRAHQVQEWQKALDVFCLPEMVFGESVLELMHESSGLLLSFNAWDALKGWVDEKLPPVRIPAANLWLDRMKPKQELLLDYDYTFTTSYCGSERLLNPPSVAPAHSNAGASESSSLSATSSSLALKSNSTVQARSEADIVQPENEAAVWPAEGPETGFREASGTSSGAEHRTTPTSASAQAVPISTDGSSSMETQTEVLCMEGPSAMSDPGGASNKPRENAELAPESGTAARIEGSLAEPAEGGLTRDAIQEVRVEAREAERTQGGRGRSAGAGSIEAEAVTSKTDQPVTTQRSGVAVDAVKVADTIKAAVLAASTEAGTSARSNSEGTATVRAGMVAVTVTEVRPAAERADTAAAGGVTCGEGLKESDATRGIADTSSALSPLTWQPCEERIDWALLERRDPILFYDEVILYEDELADNGIALCSAKVRVMPGSWFVLFRFWLRVDGALIRLRDTRLFCALDSRIEAKDNLPRQVSPLPLVVRVRSSREATFASLAAMGISTDPSLFQDPNFAASSLPQGTMSYEKVAFKKDATEGAVR